jgi:hypothetical protein
VSRHNLNVIGRVVTLGKRLGEYTREPESLRLHPIAPVAVSVAVVLILSPWLGDVFGRTESGAGTPRRESPTQPATAPTTGEETRPVQGEVEQYRVEVNSSAAAFGGAVQLRLIGVRLGDRSEYVADFSVDAGSGPIGYRNANVGFVVTVARRFHVRVESVRFADRAAIFSVTRLPSGS